MKLSDILYICNGIDVILEIPIRIYKDNNHVKSYRLENIPVDPFEPYKELLMEQNKSVSYCSTPFNQFFGIIKHNGISIVFGPVGEMAYNQQNKRDYAFSLGLSPIDFDLVFTAMKYIPLFSLENFLHLLSLLNFFINAEKKDISEIADFLCLSKMSDATLLFQEMPEMETEDLETPSHYTHSYEKEMLNFVREGDVNGLQKFLLTQNHGRVGIISSEQIRQQKNLFIISVTLISRAAVDGGLYKDEAFMLSNEYIRRCEDLFSIEAIMQLSYEMIMDYTQQVFHIDSKTSLTPLVASVVTYIRRNISADLSCKALADRFNFHRNQLNTKFKEDTGKTVSEFVMNEKINRAKSLLINTDKPLAEIADYLGFSSQSHLQTVFKRFTSRTLKEYREHNTVQK